MRRLRRPPAVVIGIREAQAIAANLGRDTRATRRRRRLRQIDLAQMAGLGQPEISHLERGHGARSSIETWIAIGIALRRPIAIGYSRDVADPALQDEGHLAAHEAVLRLAVGAGWRARVEPPSDPLRPSHASDLELTGRDGRLVLVEIWNRLDDLGAAVRSSDRKAADVARRRGGRDPVLTCWLLVDTAANHEIVRRYPAVLRARLGGSSRGWVAAVATTGIAPRHAHIGVAWIDVRTGQLRELRIPTR